MSHAEAHKLQLLLGCDASAHHTIWGSTGTNKRGESLITHTNGLVTLNRGNKPTFVTVSRAEVIDVTVCTPRFARWVKQWHVSDEPSLSDHRYIRFDIELPQVNIELLAESLQSAIITSYEASCPVKMTSTNRYTPWWTRVLSELRTATRKLYNKCKKSGSWDEYKASLTRYNRALRKAKRDSWKKFCQEFEAVPECSRIRKVGKGAVGHLPSSWREARVVFIPKEGKMSYTEAKSYRPISLTSFLLKTLERALQSRGVKPTLTRWITSMLNNRTVHVSMNLCNIGATVAAGWPQGGALSPLFWCLLVNDLLSDLRRAGFYAQGYADDITIMVSGRRKLLPIRQCPEGIAFRLVGP
ncbi:hypothetical protein Trydic_g17269 [Trypoxylus dichotomus]